MELVFKLNPTPLANAFVKQKNRELEQEKFPLDIYFCVALDM